MANYENKVFYVGRPNLPDKEIVMENMAKILDNQWLTNNGPFVQELERRIEEYLGIKHCICVCNATIGLELLQRALDLTGEVIIPAFTFIATAHSLRWQRIDPVFCDVRIEDHLIDPEKIESLITPRTSAILAVPIWGQPCDYDALERIARKHHLKLIFDSAHAFGCRRGNRFLGGFGDAEVFSFHATKVFSTGEGGAITTNSDELADKLRLMRNFGFTGYDHTDHLGTNAKMNEFAAAYGLAALDQIESVIYQNRQNHNAYLKIFHDLPGIHFLDYPQINPSNYQYVVARVRPEHRDPLVEFYHRANILVRRYFHPGCHRMEPYRSDSRYSVLELPTTEILTAETVVFPTGSQLNNNEVKHFADLYLEFWKKEEKTIPARLSANREIPKANS